MLKWTFPKRKKKVQRDETAAIFLEHCLAESDKLKNALLPKLRAYCDLKGDSAALEAIIDLPRIKLVADGPMSRARPTLDAHCLALATAQGIEAIWNNVDPSGEGRAMIEIVSKLIIEDDVGAENLGHAPNPYTSSGVHVSYAPGTFVEGTPSKQKQLTDRYRELESAPEQLVSLLTGLRLIQPSVGLLKMKYVEEHLEDGVIETKFAASDLPSPQEIESWDRDLVISDPAAALSELPPTMTQGLVSVINNIDPFWPAFSKDHRLI